MSLDLMSVDILMPRFNNKGVCEKENAGMFAKKDGLRGLLGALAIAVRSREKERISELLDILGII